VLIPLQVLHTRPYHHHHHRHPPPQTLPHPLYHIIP
jgi:hypothetical protein